MQNLQELATRFSNAASAFCRGQAAFVLAEPTDPKKAEWLYAHEIPDDYQSRWTKDIISDSEKVRKRFKEFHKEYFSKTRSMVSTHCYIRLDHGWEIKSPLICSAIEASDPESVAAIRTTGTEPLADGDALAGHP